MSLRYRLFLWVAIVFTVAFIISYYWEEHATRKSLNESYQALVKQLDQLNEEKTEAIEAYLANILYQIQAEVDAVLQGVSKFQSLRKGFEPSIDNLKNYNWLNSASLMVTNPWIDFIQSTTGKDLMSEIIVDSSDLSDALHFPVHEAFHFVALRSKKDPNKWEGPYIGISLDFHRENQKPSQRYFVFFRPETIQNFFPGADLDKSLTLSINLLEPFLKWIEAPAQTFYLEGFIRKILTAQKLLEKSPSLIPNQKAWDTMIPEKVHSIQPDPEKPLHCFSFFNKVGTVSSEDLYDQKQISDYVRQYIENYTKVGLICGLTMLTHANLFGKNPLSETFPKGMGVMDENNFCGKGLFSDEVFYTTPMYHVSQELAKMKDLPENFLTAYLDVITPEGMEHAFFGNTLKLDQEIAGEMRTGYLTIGVHGGSVLSSLARSTHEQTLFIAKDKIIAVVAPDGKHVPGGPWYQLDAKTLLEKPSGIIKIEGKEYYFLHISPYRLTNLDFFIFTPKDKEFAFIDVLNKKAKEIVDSISFQMRLASVAGLLFVLILLNNISRRITRPITHLAEVTQVVAEGKLDDIDIPEDTKGKRHDEIATLYHSFFEMVKGLREKERVRGILNKVVSEEIAEETLKGNILLGGEEKLVTILFADIRGFTKMIEKMDPKEVIQLINTCMTKVSEKIDQFEGVIDKYVGDEVMALFGAPIDKPGSALRAVQSALAIMDVIKAWNQERVKEGLFPVEMGIGIHTGMVVAGNMGAENRLNYTVLGSNVNLASRICSGAKTMEILISESTLEAEGVKESVECERLSTMELKGFTDPVAVYSVKKPEHRTFF